MRSNKEGSSKKEKTVKSFIKKETPRSPKTELRV